MSPSHLQVWNVLDSRWDRVPNLQPQDLPGVVILSSSLSQVEMLSAKKQFTIVHMYHAKNILYIYIPVVPHKAVAEVSKIGNL